ncbi:MAG TPA: acyl-CoA reductase, partial [Puia sp.]|nr:acyl-CoA reductase [Puia sp.]
MNVDHRIDLLAELGAYCLSTEPAWLAAQRRAHAANGWFTPEFIGLAVHTIATRFLQRDALRAWAGKYGPHDEPARPVTVGLTMAGNIPLVGFHDFLSIFVSGHRQMIRPSSKDDILIRHLAEHLCRLDPAVAQRVGFADILRGCDAYIATGSNNSARYFEYYFSKYPHIIRRNRTSVALLTGAESRQDLDRLADDVYQYFGLGCRNVTQLYVPENYDFLSLLQAFRKYNYLAQLSKYKHNYDYQLTLLILNKKTYMSNESILLTEDASPFSPISVLHYAYYRRGEALPPALSGGHPDIQCIVGADHLASAAGLSRVPPLVAFGQAQQPALDDYADGVDTMKFLL